ncbi:MAG: hypothetical protein JEZ14_21615 [Marinilabiliaceae bacterium]|nr:hypothetical protein [Marinilabiliaceae bacterium]
MRKAKIYFKDEFAGVLKQQDDGRFGILLAIAKYDTIGAVTVREIKIVG